MLTLQDGDEVLIQMQIPTPPWNGTMLLLRGRWALLTLERPDPMMELELFESGEPNQNGHLFPNTMVAWAAVGTKGMAQELVQHILDDFSVRAKWPSWRGRFNMSLALPSDGDALPAELANITRSELEQEIQYALERTKRQRDRSGNSIGDRLSHAENLLKERPELRKRIEEVLEQQSATTHAKSGNWNLTESYCPCQLSQEQSPFATGVQRASEPVVVNIDGFGEPSYQHSRNSHRRMR